MEYKRWTVDVIIPTYRPDENVTMLVKKLLRQTYPIHEIHIVDTDTGSFPGELKELGKPVRITSISKKEFDHGGTRRQAAIESDADILVYMTQDAMPVNDRLLENLLKPFQKEEVAAAYARQLAQPDSGEIETYTRLFNYPDKSCIKSAKNLGEMGIKTYFCSNVCAAYRKSVYDALGGFEKKIIFNEDMVMAAKMIQSGSSVAYAADAKVFHSHQYTCTQQFRRNFDIAVSQTAHPEIFADIKSESEGIQLVKNTAAYLLKRGKPWLILSLILKSAAKYLGFLFGRHYKNLPDRVILLCTSNPDYWKK
jgi:rhamnosyltransferase